MIQLIEKVTQGQRQKQLVFGGVDTTTTEVLSSLFKEGTVVWRLRNKTNEAFLPLCSKELVIGGTKISTNDVFLSLFKQGTRFWRLRHQNK